MKQKCIRLSVVCLIAGLLMSCIPDGVKEQMNTQMTELSQLMADQEFKKAIAFIELHKVRNGNYPTTLSELEFLPKLDQALTTHLVYTKRDNGYELDINYEFPTTITGGDVKPVVLEYPDAFWKGLGCVKSNAMKGEKVPDSGS